MFAAAAQLANSAVLRIHGQPVTIVAGGVATDLVGVFLAPGRDSQGPTEHAFTRPDPRVLVPSEELSATGARAGDTVAVSGQNYFIADLVDEDGGMTSVVVRPE
jgi:hypothetical protein